MKQFTLIAGNTRSHIHCFEGTVGFLTQNDNQDFLRY